MSPSPAHPLRIVHTESSLGWGGQEIRLLTEAAGFRGRGHEMHLLCPPQANIFEAAQKMGIPVTPLPMGRKNLLALVAVWNWLRRNPVDLVVTHSSTDSWLAALACRMLAQPPRIVRLRHISTPVANNRATRWLYGQGCDFIVTTGACIRNSLIRVNNLDGNRIRSVATGIDLDHFTPGDSQAARTQLDLPQDQPLIGIVATLRSWKGHQHLVEALAMLRRPEIRLIIVGDGPQRENLETLIDTKGLTDQVVMAGNRNNVVPWMRAMDIMVLPSYANEGIPQALMQAMACARPVIGADTGGIPEILRHRHNGILISPRDVQGLAAALAGLLTNPSLRARIAKNALAEARKKFGQELMLDRMESIFRSVLEGTTPSPIKNH